MMNNLNGNTFRKIAFIGNYVPRQCGIATFFTTDLCEAMAAGYPETEFFAIAMNDRACGYDYPARVRFEIQQDELPMYHSAADFLEIFDVDLVCLQHEFGIFGGRAGRHVLALLEDLHISIVTTLHTVLAKPDVEQKSVMDRLIQLSDRMVVMSRRGSGYLQEIYGLPEERIDLIPHGIHDVPFMDPNFYKDRFQVEGKKVLLTFGLVSPNKGIEYGIQALPEILKHIPDFVYIILGATHPNIKRDDGEQYRHSLEQLAVDLGVSENVQFHDRYVSLDELIQYIGAADVYLTPYLNPAQIVSGTLAYSAGAGKAVISTPYWYAEELLADGRGEIVPFRDSQAIAKVVVDLFHNEMQRHAMRKRAYLYTRDMIWPKIAQDYMDSFTRAISGRTDSPKNTRSYALIHQMENGESLDRLPPLNLNHLKRMTDDTGILQHAIFDLPNYREGYTTDDNARALLLTLLFSRMNRDNEAAVELSELSARYLAFLWYAFDEQRGRFHNFMGFNRSWLDEVGSEDSSCRTIWSLGAVLGQSEDENLVGAAARLFHQALPAVLDFSSPRAWSYALLGIHEYLRRYPGDRAALSTGKSLAWKLADLYRDTCGPGWHWFEDTLAYDNAVLPHALYCFSQQLADPEIHQISLDALHWLLEVQSGPDGCFCPIGSQGFYQRDGTRARFDQQPIEAWATVSACLEVYRSTGEAFWLQEAQRAFSWFLGRNDLGQSLYDVHTGGCRDGLHPERMNHNQGAESTLAFLTSLAEMHLVQTSLVPRHEVRHLSQALSAPPALGD